VSLKRFALDVTAQNVVEMGLLIAAIATVVLIGLNTFGTQITPWFTQLAGRITTTGT
jgi:Flp pilus assembly pilin Flp